jgi:hypothetical protein
MASDKHSMAYDTSLVSCNKLSMDPKLKRMQRFGNTYLSFNVAESFHPVFGPILMVRRTDYVRYNVEQRTIATGFLRCTIQYTLGEPFGR